VAADSVIERNPEVIVGSWCGKPVRKARIASRAGWEGVAAVRSGHIYEVKSVYILQPGPAALTEGVRQLHEIIRSVAAEISGNQG
jgi:iron complex transport system substrate-binding protein